MGHEEILTLKFVALLNIPPLSKTYADWPMSFEDVNLVIMAWIFIKYL